MRTSLPPATCMSPDDCRLICWPGTQPAETITAEAMELASATLLIVLLTIMLFKDWPSCRWQAHGETKHATRIHCEPHNGILMSASTMTRDYANAWCGGVQCVQPQQNRTAKARRVAVQFCIRTINKPPISLNARPLRHSALRDG